MWGSMEQPQPRNINGTAPLDQVAAFPAEVEQPTDLNVAKTASAAFVSPQAKRKAGRKHNRADQIQTQTYACSSTTSRFG